MADGFEAGELKPGDPEFKKTVNNLFKHEPLKEGESKPEDWDLKTLISKTWEKANVYLLSVGEQDINQGFEFGVALTTLPEAKGEQERINEWLRGMGLFVLSQNQYLPMLLDKFTLEGRSGKLFTSIRGAILRNINHIKTEKEAMVHPEAYSTLQATYLGLGLKDTYQKEAKELYQLASSEKQNQAAQIRLYLESFPEVSFLAKRLA